MHIPTETFERLVGLVAISDRSVRDAQSVTEVFTGDELGRVPVGTADDVVTAVAKARAAQAQWASRPVADRAAVLDRFSTLVLKRADHVMDVLQAETGKARGIAQTEVIDVASNARYYAVQAPKLLAPRGVDPLLPVLTKTVVRYQPKGIVGVIGPWNYPISLTIGDALPALVAGNAVIIKPDSNTPFSVLACAELLFEAGLPRDLLAVVPGPGSVVGSAIVESCDFLMFTGSTATGRHLAEQCGRRLIGFSAELGGKNPMIVTAGANLDRAARVAAHACFDNAGQLCLSIERIYVEESVSSAFLDRFVEQTQAIRVAPDYDFSATMGSLISTQHLETVDAHVADARAKGATVVTGGRARPDLGPSFFEPTILTGVTEEMACFAGETFGPVVSVYPVADVDEAIRRANATEYGLNASVFAGSARAGEDIAARLRAGTVNVDDGYSVAFGSLAAPMGGMGVSGLGRRHGPEGLLKYCESQTVGTAYTEIDSPLGLPADLARHVRTPIIRLLRVLPGR
ncbi:succinic semialdehyde dehydrogenase [Smaragdicoccus niigatensis]|uniref:succinic semialdehyde dehydrogenase n=1 Tax=Smaragdicoccus niigatensis TaxID=359359 RepID=UPI000362193C|nr:succinic semialdehyde dehydrogenase [Smaragdicoccus niigatensis]